MKARLMQRPSSRLLPIMLLVLALSLTAVACGTDGERSSGADSEPEVSELRRDSGQSPPVDEEEEADREDGPDDESDRAEEQSEEEAEEPEPMPEPVRDTGILKRLMGGGSGGSFARDLLSLLPASELVREITAYDLEAIRSAGGIREPLLRELDASFDFLGSYCIALDDVDTIVAQGKWNELLLV